MKNILLAAAMSIIASSAFAADALSVDASPQFTWTGAYIGVQGGYTWTKEDFHGFDQDLDGGLLGAHAGYNWQLSTNFVGGIEVDAERVWNEQNFIPFGGEFQTGITWQGSARLRAGYAIDRTMIFATGGVAVADAFVKGLFSPDLDQSKTFTGWTAGVGVEHAFTNHLTARLEYRYADFGTEKFDEIEDVPVALKQNSIRAGLSYKF